MKVFISHQQADYVLAGKISAYLKINHQMDSYLDLIDPNASKAGDQLGEYLRDVMGKCTQLMAVVSENTKNSWWVPWEIGVATEKDHPIATFAGDNTELPIYLKKWPYLKTNNDLDAYAIASKAAMNQFNLRKSFTTDSVNRHSSTQEFYRSLRASLRQ
jgi:TIR domain